jgi:hypothetical protein
LTFHIKIHFYFEQAAHERWFTREPLRKNDTPLENLWDEICVQVQYRQSMFYDAYLDTITKTISRELEGVAEHLRQAIGSKRMTAGTGDTTTKNQKTMCRPFGMAILPTTYFMDMC